MATTNLPDAAEAVSYVERLSNWGRWGADDQLGTLNLLKEEHRVAAARLVTTGRTVSCARTLVTAFGDPASAAQMYWVVTGEGVCHEHEAIPPTRFGAAGKVASAVEYIGLVYHGPNCTHLDTPAHLFWEGKVYNDRPAMLTTSEHGAIWCPVTNMKDGVIGRGVLLDIPRSKGVEALPAGHAVTPDELSAAAEVQGVEVGEGDIVLMRTGRWHPAAEEAAEAAKAISDDPAHWHAMSGWHPACMEWVHERDVAMIGCDYPNDVIPAVYEELPGGVHVLALVAMGMPLIDNCDLEALAETCAELERWEFQFIMSPLRLAGGSGSPVNPLAVF
jgi:kynurenine formamidase